MAAMSITLRRDQQEWLEAQVKAGAYDTVDEAIASILAERMQLEGDDLSWAMPLVDEGRASIERGEVLTVEEHLAHVNETLKKIRDR